MLYCMRFDSFRMRYKGITMTPPRACSPAEVVGRDGLPSGDGSPRRPPRSGTDGSIAAISRTVDGRSRDEPTACRPGRGPCGGAPTRLMTRRPGEAMLDLVLHAYDF